MHIGRCVVRPDHLHLLTKVIAEEDEVIAHSSLTLVPTSVITICSSKGNLVSAGKVLDTSQGAVAACRGRLQLEMVWPIDLLRASSYAGAWIGHIQHI
jgi:hypothetical protein